MSQTRTHTALSTDDVWLRGQSLRAGQRILGRLALHDLHLFLKLMTVGSVTSKFDT